MRYKAAILLATGVGILLLMILFIGPDRVVKALEMADIWVVILAILIQITIYGMWTQRWNLTATSVDISIKKFHLFSMLMVGLAINNLTPSARGGGEPIRAYILGKYTKSPMEKSFATVAADRALDTFPFIILAIITIISMVLYYSLSVWMVCGLLFSVIIITIAFFIAIYICFDDKIAKKVTLWIVDIIKRFFRGKYHTTEKKALDTIRGFQKSMRIMVKNKKVLIWGLSLSSIIWILEILRVYVVFSAFNVNVPVILIAEVFIIATLIGMLPFLPGGLGAVDGVMILLYSYAGVPPFISAAATIVERLISFWMTSIIGVVALPYFGVSVVERILRRS